MNNSYYCEYQSPLGALTIICKNNHITHCDYADGKNKEELKALRETCQHKKVAIMDSCCSQLDGYFNGTLKQFNLPLAPQGTDFQTKVWKALTTINYGETKSYLQIAQHIKNPKACRAVGAANGRNPIAIIIPCHRVIGSNHSLTGYAGGLKRKKQLLQLEQAL